MNAYEVRELYHQVVATLRHKVDSLSLGHGAVNENFELSHRSRLGHTYLLSEVAD